MFPDEIICVRFNSKNKKISKGGKILSHERLILAIFKLDSYVRENVAEIKNSWNNSSYSCCTKDNLQVKVAVIYVLHMMS